MRTSFSKYLELHWIVLIYGTTAILGKLIALPADWMVGWRILITVGFLLLVGVLASKSFRVNRRNLFVYMMVGQIVAFHWITFFHAIKISNISVSLGSFASTTLFASLLEPLFQRRRIRMLEVLIGALILSGLYLIFRFETRYNAGILTAVLSAFLAALFTVINQVLIQKQKTDSFAIGFYEMASGLAGITIYLALFQDFTQIVWPSSGDWVYLLILALVCTAYPFIATIRLMKSISAYTVTLSVNLEPVYGILMAMLLFGQSELLSTGFYVGTGIILISVFVYPILLQKFYRPAKSKS